MAHITDRMYEKRWGVFNHFLFDGTKEEESRWNEFVEGFDVELVARNLHEMGAGYYFITTMQGRKFMIAPNQTFDRIAGTKAGEACATRDLVEDLYQALSRYGIDLYLYFTGDGPYKDEEIGRRFGYTEPREHNMNIGFAEKWASVLEEYAVRYGDKVKGWWIDGCYDYFGYDDELLEPYYRAVKKGNPDAMLACNNAELIRPECWGKAGKPQMKKWFAKEDFITGELTDFVFVPDTAFVDGARAHFLIPLGTDEYNVGWRNHGVKRSHEHVKDYVRKVHEAGGVVTIDIYVDRYGHFDEDQMAVLRGI